jgi:hypothetical protein
MNPRLVVCKNNAGQCRQRKVDEQMLAPDVRQSRRLWSPVANASSEASHPPVMNSIVQSCTRTSGASYTHIVPHNRPLVTPSRQTALQLSPDQLIPPDESHNRFRRKPNEPFDHCQVVLRRKHARRIEQQASQEKTEGRNISAGIIAPSCEVEVSATPRQPEQRFRYVRVPFLKPIQNRRHIPFLILII